MQYRYIFLLTFWAPCILLGQSLVSGEQVNFQTHSQQQWLYRISAAEAELFLKTKSDEFVLEPYLHSLVDSMHYRHEPEGIPNGHYLILRANEERLEIDHYSRHDHTVQLTGDDKRLSITVTDLQGNSVSNGQVLLNDKVLTWSDKVKAFRSRGRCKNGGWLRIQLPQDTLFYHVTYSQAAKSGEGMFWRTTTGRILKYPYRVIKFPYAYLKNGLRYKYWSNPWRQWFGPKSRRLRGYIALSKPQYRPGDTLKVKAYLTDRKGKPLREEVNLRLGQGRLAIASTRLAPERPGVFIWQTVLLDTLTLDKYYQISFSEHKYRRGGIASMSQTFRLADYQLRSAEFSLTELTPSPHAGDLPIRFRLSAQDKNGNPLPGGQVSLVALRKQVFGVTSDSIRIPDTLWRKQLPLGFTVDNIVTFPDSLLPPADLALELEAYFSVAGGESAKRTLSFVVKDEPIRIKHAFEDGNLNIWATGRDSTLHRPFIALSTHRKGRQRVKTDSMRLPVSIPVDVEVINYSVSAVGMEPYPIQVDAQASGVSVFAQHLSDSVLVLVNNPNGLEVRLQVFAGNQLAYATVCETDTCQMAIKASDRKTYLVHHDYYWGGGIVKKQKSVRVYRKKLAMQTDLPSDVYPGQTLNVKVSVTDQRGRPARGVELAAMGVNGKFDNPTGHLRTPNINYQNLPEHRSRHQYRVVLAELSRSTKITEAWYKRLDLDSLLYYQIRYQSDGVASCYLASVSDSLLAAHGQISPFIVKNGHLQPVYMVYLDRQLIYSYLTRDLFPYSFTANPLRTHQLKLRTFQGEYTIENVQLKAGQRLILVLDEDTFRSSENWAGRISYVSRSPELSQQEIHLHNSSMMRIREEEVAGTLSWLYQQPGQVYAWKSGRRTFAVGPFVNRQDLIYSQTGGMRDTFMFEPGFDYNIQPGRLKLYEWEPFGIGQKQTLPSDLPHPSLNVRSMTYHDIVLDYPLVRTPKYSQRKRFAALSGGSLALFLPKTKNDILAISLRSIEGDGFVTEAGVNQFNDLLPGFYELRLLGLDDTYYRKEIQITAHEQLVLAWDSIAWEVMPEEEIDFWYDKEKRMKTYLQLGYEATQIINQGRNPYINNGVLVSGQLFEKETGEPVIFGSVHLAGTNLGTETDFDGNWSLWVPSYNSILTFSYLGLQDVSVHARSAGYVAMEAGGVLLESVMVVSYQIPLIEQDNTTQGGTISASEIRSLPTRNINALAATTAGLVSAEGDDINIRGSRNSATVYYVDGIRVQGNLIPDSEINLVTGEERQFALGVEVALPPSRRLRTTFRDDAYWQPNLITDRNGEAFFQLTFPDDITRWETFVVGMDHRERAGFAHQAVEAFQPLLAQLYLPRFLLPGDRVDLSASSLNYRSQSIPVQTTFSVQDEPLLESQFELQADSVEYVNYTIPEGLDSLQARYTLRMGSYEDGEERRIPIFRLGTEETLGEFHRLVGDTTVSMRFDPADGPVTVYAEGDLLPILLREMDALIDYPYGCNEQTASRLLALLMKKRIQETLGEPFTESQLILDMMALLRKRQADDGSWGWWEGRRNYWMTIYVLSALHTADEEGYTTQALDRGLVFLTNELPNLRGRDRLSALALFSEVGQNMDYARLLSPYDTLDGVNWITLTTQLIAQREQLLTAQTDTLMRYHKSTLFGGQYWGHPGYGFYNNQMQHTLLAYRILREAGQTDELSSIRQFFLEQRELGRSYHPWGSYRNTFEAAKILQTILPDVLAAHDVQNTEQLSPRVDIDYGAGSVRLDSFPRKLELLPEAPRLAVQKSGVGDVYFTAYQQRWNSAPERIENDFVIDSELLQDNEVTEILEANRSAEMRVTVKIDKASDYLMIEVPIPAGCSYGENEVNRYRGQETHREYRRNKVAIFCEHLNAGTYTYRIALEPRFSGHFQLNPAKVEQMYFPVFFARDGMKEVQIDRVK